jgi:hypothetical protein
MAEDEEKRMGCLGCYIEELVRAPDMLGLPVERTTAPAATSIPPWARSKPKTEEPCPWGWSQPEDRE